MLAKRNASGHDTNASTRLGDSVTGTGYITTIVRTGCDNDGGARLLPSPGEPTR